MVKHTITIDVKEIRSIEFRCKCGGLLAVNIDTQRLGHTVHCPNCGESLWTKGEGLQEQIFALIVALRDIAREKRMSVTFTQDDK